MGGEDASSAQRERMETDATRNENKRKDDSRMDGWMLARVVMMVAEGCELTDEDDEEEGKSVRIYSTTFFAFLQIPLGSS